MITKYQVARGVFKLGPIPTGNPRSATSPTTPFVMVGQEKAAILEPGEEGQGEPVLQAIKELGIDRNRIAYITVSHIHGHHSESLNVLVKETKAKIVVHQRAVPHLVDPSRLNASMDQVWGTEGGHCAVLKPVPENRIMGCAGGEVIDLGERELEIIDSRGHAPHHICVFDRLTRALWTGDMAGVLAFGSERGHPDILPPLFDVKSHMESLHRCRALKPSVLFSFTAPGGVSYAPDRTLQMAEEDILAIERICREGMKKKLTAQQIAKQVSEHRAQNTNTGVYSPIIKPSTAEEDTIGGADGVTGGRYGVLAFVENMPPFGMIAYLKREDPSLPWPKGMPGGEGTGRGL
ncbi:MAG: MBL fold metallo-hydrolase [Chloroflexi bacterium]|nr:MBL fold metallo-hydrolase [Chloroflexota bacterium]